MEKENQSFITNSDMKYAEKIKETHCVVDYIDRRADPNDDDTISTTYKSSNSRYYRIGKERFTATEGLFDSANMCDKAVQDIISESINTCDYSIQDDMAKNIIVTGGTSLLPKFAERLQKELSQYRNDINIISVPNRQYLSYSGASKHSLSDFIEQLWLTKKEFDESGPSIVHKKFL